MPAEYPTIAEQVGSVPDAPGVYLWKDSSGDVLYVGKAKSLRKRTHAPLVRCGRWHEPR